MAKAKKTRKRYTAQKRSEILATAAKEGLTAIQVQKKFGVSPVTYYSWRKKLAKGKRGGRAATVGRGGALGGRVRSTVEKRMRSILPQLIESEVNRYLDRVLGSGDRRRRA